MNLKNTVLIVLIATTLLSSLDCSELDRPSFSAPHGTSSIHGTPTPDRPDNGLSGEGLRRFSFHGVSFEGSNLLMEGITGSAIESHIPDDPASRPDTFQHKHVKISIAGEYARRNQRASFPPEIRIFPIKQYLSDLQDSKNTRQRLIERLESLKLAIKTEQREFEGEHPFVEFIDATQIVNSHLSHLTFQNGRGIFYLTQFRTSDPVLVNNSSLVYVFQGISNDGAYFVSATFPVKTEFLPEEGVNSYKGYSIPDSFFEPAKYTENEKEYSRYLAGIQIELDHTPEQDFEPNLFALRRLVESLEVDSYR